MKKLFFIQIEGKETVINKISKFTFFFSLIITVHIQKKIIENINKNPIISIIIPTYNREKYIVNAIKSCLKQTYKPKEIIIIDDCSKDNTKKLVKKIKDRRVEYIKLFSHKGACYSRNLGIRKAKGSYISFIDSDDVFLPEKLKKQINNLQYLMEKFGFKENNN